MSKLQKLGFSGPYTANADGSVNGIFNTYPYNIHRDATSEIWAALQSDIADNSVVVSPYIAPAIVPVNQNAELKIPATRALNQSDIVIIRCAEAGVVIPQEWKDYRTALRAIISGADTSSISLPVKPAYPAGT